GAERRPPERLGELYVLDLADLFRMPRQKPRHVRFRTLRTHLPGRVAVVAAHDLDEILAALHTCTLWVVRRSSLQADEPSAGRGQRRDGGQHDGSLLNSTHDVPPPLGRMSCCPLRRHRRTTPPA